uniref:Uncharacterized protein n=1 Tax=Micrurus lemniscatus lemniscatus TaxID=129467 RepID=A0A2D4J5C3_MICLE
MTIQVPAMQSAVRLDVVDQGQTIAMTAYTITINLKIIHESVFPTVHLVTIAQTRNAVKSVHPTVKHVLEVTVINVVPVNLVTLLMKSLEVVLPLAQTAFTWITIRLSAVNAVKIVGHALNFIHAQNADMV